MRIPIIIGMVMTGCAASAQLSATSVTSPTARSCEYMNFAIYRDLPNSNKFRGAGLTNEAIHREVETIFARELESAGFHHGGDGEVSWLFLRAILQDSTLRSNADRRRFDPR